MNTHIFKNQKVQLIAVFFLVIGLGVGIYLVQTKQIFKPKATADLHDAFTITKSDGTSLRKINSNTYETNSLNIKIRLDDLEALTQ